LFLGDYTFHVIGRFENLAALLEVLSDHLGQETSIGRRNASSRPRSEQAAAAELVDLPAFELRHIDPLPAYPAFYNEELAALVADYYRRDVEEFGYEYAETGEGRRAA